MAGAKVPRFSVWLIDKNNTKSRTQVGVAFDDGFNGGGYSIALGPGVVIGAREREDCYLTLKPWVAMPRKQKVAANEPAEPEPKVDAAPSDIPF